MVDLPYEGWGWRDVLQRRGIASQGQMGAEWAGFHGQLQFGKAGAQGAAQAQEGAGRLAGGQQQDAAPPAQQAVETQVEGRGLDGRGHVQQGLEPSGRDLPEEGQGQVQVRRRHLVSGQWPVIAPPADPLGEGRWTGQGEEQAKRAIGHGRLRVFLDSLHAAFLGCACADLNSNLRGARQQPKYR